MGRCHPHSNFATCTASRVSSLGLVFTTSRTTPRPSASPCAAAEKNDLRRLWPEFLLLLRSAATPGPRPGLWRQAGLSVVHRPARRLLAVWRREDRTLGLAGRQPVLHAAFRL